MLMGEWSESCNTAGFEDGQRDLRGMQATLEALKARFSPRASGEEGSPVDTLTSAPRDCQTSN